MKDLWKQVGERLTWMKPFSKIQDSNFYLKDFKVKWYEDGVLNACYNCVDRHLPESSDKVAILWQGDERHDYKKITYKELSLHVQKTANLLKNLGVTKGDRVVIYMPMIPEATVFMLACARIGAIHSVVFGGFSSESLAVRIADCEAKVVVTVNEGKRGGKSIPFKSNLDDALTKAGTESVNHSIIVKRTDASFQKNLGDVIYEEAIKDCADECPCEPMGAEDPFFILYTSGSTGKPKGVLHTTGGYLAYASYTHEAIFNVKKDEVYWCTADIGWITGHSYVVYGPLANGCTTLMYEGNPNYPDYGRFWQIIDQHQVNIFYTAPTAIRTLKSQGDHWIIPYKLDSLRLLGTVGEPIDPTSWNWFHTTIGKERCPIADTWWQTETGGIMIAPNPTNNYKQKPGSVVSALGGIQIGLVNEEGKLLEGPEQTGHLVILDSWPGQVRTFYGDHERYLNTYFSTYNGMYFTGDGASRDKEGDYWIIGRVDDVLNVSGHRLGTAEIETALTSHPHVAEAAVVGIPHEIKGEGIYAYVFLQGDGPQSNDLTKDIIQHVRKVIGPIATIDHIQYIKGLPKTRSGKIMRRILRKIASNETENLGDTSTLSDPGVIEELLAGRETI